MQVSGVYTTPVLTKRVTYSWAELNDAARRMKGKLRLTPRATYMGPSIPQVRTAPQLPRREAPQPEPVAEKSALRPSAEAAAEADARMFQFAVEREEMIAEIVNSVTPIIVERVAAHVDAVLDEQMENALQRIKTDVRRSIESTVHGVVRQAVQTGARTGKLLLKKAGSQGQVR
jgi:hypothetical protein